MIVKKGAILKMFPAQAGVIPSEFFKNDHILHVPRAGGGDPAYGGYRYYVKECSPRRRG